MKQSPLQLKQSIIREVVCKAAETSDFAGTINLTTNPTFARSEDDPKLWQITLMVHFKAGSGESKPLQYTGHIDLFGLFEMTPGPTEEATLRVLAVNAPSMLYATARDTLAFLTSRGPHGTYLLPTITFSDILLNAKQAVESAPTRDTEKVPSKSRRSK
jgi:preprotein translocase subunit SecB